jgi:Uncharacterized protein conserved in bacteria (DUF2252)
MDLFATCYRNALALSHARSGRLITLRRYVGKSERFDRALAAFSLAYVDHKDRNHAVRESAVRR